MQYDPMADGRNAVVCGKARFTFLTSRMVRLEYAADGQFEDRATFAVVNRRMPAVKLRKSVDGKKLILNTSRLKLTFLADGKKLSASNLRIDVTSDAGRHSWRPGMKDPLNLPGTGRTLDGIDGNIHQWGDRKGKPVEICPGLISRSGWAVYDDSGTVVRTEDGWVTPRSDHHRQDLYFLGYGRQYKDALADAACVFGRQPVPPRFTLGLWWSRYWAYTDEELRGIVAEFDRYRVPLDVFVIDMDWHLEGWTGYTWDKRYYPQPRKLLDWLHRRGLKVTLNQHPAAGVGPHEAAYDRMAKAMGMDPASKRPVPFDCADRRFMDAYFKHLHHPLEADGVDFWWMDWQQGHISNMPGLDPLPWLNITHWEDQDRRGHDRPLNFSRYGGLGSGRYPIGFSGDTHITWASLAYQPQFTAEAANVLYGHWSHDIGGHQGGQFTPQMYLRWIQFGVYSPVLRMHTTKHPNNERRFWEMPHDYSRHMMDAIDRRYELAPYIYTEHHANVETGLSLCRPLYHEWPGEKKAYECPNEYMFGREMLAAPVTAPCDERTQLAAAKIYLPPGEWFDTAVGVLEKGGRTITRSYTLSEIPVFVRAGAVIPGLADKPQRLPEGGYEKLLMTIYPGKAGQYELFEDDGASRETAGARAMLSQRTAAGRTILTIGKAAGGYDGFKPARSLEVRLPATVPPAKVVARGKALPYVADLGDAGWTYDGTTATTIIRIASLDLRKGLSVEVTHGANPKAALGWAGIIRRLRWMCRRAQRGPTPEKHAAAAIDRLAPHLSQAGLRATYDPTIFQEEAAETRRQLASMGSKLTRLGRELRNKKVYAWSNDGAEKADGLDACVEILKVMKREKLFRQ